MPKRKGSLAPRTNKGLSDKFVAKSGRGSGNRLGYAKDDPTNTIQFFVAPDQFETYLTHSFQDDGWTYVPCAEDGCPLCEDEDEDVRKTSPRFATNVYNHQDKKVYILEGPAKGLGGLIWYRYKRLKAKGQQSKFLKTVYDVTKLPTSPVTYNFERAEEDPIALKGKKQHDITEHLTAQMRAYYGEDMKSSPAMLSDDDDDDIDDEDDVDIYEEADLKKMNVPALKKIAKELEIEDIPKGKAAIIEAIIEAQDEDEDDDDEDDDDEDDDDLDDDDEDEDDEDEDDEDEDDEDEDDEEEEDEAPRRKPVSSSRKKTSKKAPAKAAAKKGKRR